MTASQTASHTPGPWTALDWEREKGGKDWNLWGPTTTNHAGKDGDDLRGDFGTEADARLCAAAPILPDMYASEINFSLGTFWDGGFDVKLGDDWNGFKATTQTQSFVEAVEWLRDQAIQHFPQSDFAERYAGIAKAPAA